MSAAVPVLVIGSGIAGASVFFALARRGVAVTLVDAGEEGQATAASAGIIQPWSSGATGDYYATYAAGAAFYPQLLRHLADFGVTRTDYRRSGGLLVNREDALLDAAQDLLEQRRAAGAAAMGEVRRLAPGAARELFPPLAPELGAVWIEGGARVDGRTLRDALLEAGRRAGGRVLTGRAELGAADNGGVRARVDGQPVVAGDVVLAAGAWSAPLLTELGVALPVEPQRGQITHLRVQADTSGWPSVHPLSHHYLVAFDEGRLAVGATRENGSGFDPRVTAAGQEQVLRDALSVAPGLAQATLLETRVGLRPLPGGELPLVGAVPGVRGLWVATGYGAGGLTMGPLLGDALAAAVCAGAGLGDGRAAVATHVAGEADSLPDAGGLDLLAPLAPRVAGA